MGGITPGSMPPHSKKLSEEGAAFKSFLLVENGQFREAEITKALTTPTNAEGAAGTRGLANNISDLKAQIAANQKGIQLVSELIDIYKLHVVQAYMKYIQENAEIAVRDMLKEIARQTLKRTGTTVLYAEDKMDDGSPIKLKIHIDETNGSALCDFTGSGYQVHGNCNAPKAITLSALIYCLRCMVGHDVPLNQGCLKPIQVIIPKNSILDPSDDAAVVGGNVLTSQRIVDVILAAFQVCAASQGCMNNITFGDEQFGYYETVAGGSLECNIPLFMLKQKEMFFFFILGSGAGPMWHGMSGVHTHMTNTRITDPEILESRYPIILNKFCLRTDESGGRGRFNGGEGVHRELLFRKSLMLSVLTERRVLRPYGMHGGEDGKTGENLLLKVNGQIIYLGSKTAVNVETGDIFAMKTPGGGGFGIYSDNNNQIFNSNHERNSQNAIFVERGSVFEYRQAQESV